MSTSLSMPTLLYAPLFRGHSTEVFARTDGTLYFYRKPPLFLLLLASLGAAVVNAAAYFYIRSVGLADWTSMPSLILMFVADAALFRWLGSYQRHRGGRPEELTELCPCLDVASGVLRDRRQRELGRIPECLVIW